MHRSYLGQHKNCLWSHLPHDCNKFNEFILQIDNAVNEITTVGHEFGFKGLDEENVNKLLNLIQESLMKLIFLISLHREHMKNLTMTNPLHLLVGKSLKRGLPKFFKL